MSKNQVKNNNKGFTIIEVLIVLAIAALILLVVFLAVPNLQRSQRNNGRQSEAARLSSQISTSIGNNQGALPSWLPNGTATNTGTAKTDSYGYCTGFGNFKYLKVGLPTSTCGTAATSIGYGADAATATQTLTAGEIMVFGGTASAITVKPPATGDAVGVFAEEQCGAQGTQMKLVAGTAGQSVALVYTTETATGSYNLACIQTQS